MKINNLKIHKKALMFLIAGTIGLTSTGCNLNTKSGTEIQIENTKIPETNKKTNQETIENNIKQYKTNTFGYTKKNVILKAKANNNSSKVGKLDQYKKVKLIEKQDDWNLVKAENKVGYIKDSNIKKLEGSFIEVDISNQKLKYYNKKGKVTLKTNVVTGLKNQRDTVLGCYKIYYKQQDRNLRGANYVSHVDYWMPFYGGYGLHDADWRYSFGKKIYTYNGSHGCVNMPDDKAKKLYKKVNIGTKVLIHR